MIYESKKNVGMKVKVVDKVTNGENTAYMLEYLPGYDDNKTGHQFSISESTLKRWWKLVDETDAPEEKSVAEILHLDMDKINEPYPEPKEKKYIPKPQSVIEYEEKKTRARRNVDIPEFETIKEDIGFACAKFNTNYVALKNSATTVWRKANAIDIYADAGIWEVLTEQGFESKANNDKARPYHIAIKTQEQYEHFRVIINQVYCN